MRPVRIIILCFFFYALTNFNKYIYLIINVIKHLIKLKVDL